MAEAAAGFSPPQPPSGVEDPRRCHEGRYVDSNPICAPLSLPSIDVRVSLPGSLIILPGNVGTVVQRAREASRAKVYSRIGIDLGTTYSCVGVWRNGRVEICTNDQGYRITPSYVAWTDEGERLIGDAAKNQASSNPQSTVRAR